MKRYFRRLKKYFGIGTKKRVHIKENKNIVICPGISTSGGKNNNRNGNKNKNTKRKSPYDDDLKYTFSDFEMALKNNNSDK